MTMFGSVVCNFTVSGVRDGTRATTCRTGRLTAGAAFTTAGAGGIDASMRGAWGTARGDGHSANISSNAAATPTPEIQASLRQARALRSSSAITRLRTAVKCAADGTSEVVLAISETAWLERLLVALGPDARVEAPPELVTLGATAAARLRQRYADS